ncbi:hypothetical protein PCYB_006810, partial [Plasmodium cynomolgi strain B]
LYIDYVKECHNDNDYDFCRELENYKHIYEEKVKYIGKCDGLEIILPSALKHDLRDIIMISMIILTMLPFLLFVLYKVKLFG